MVAVTSNAMPVVPAFGATPRAAAGAVLVPLGLLLIAVTLLQRFAVPAAGSQLGIGFVLGLAVTGWGLLAGRLVIEPVRFVLFSLVLAAILATLALGEGGFSLLSLAMFCLLYFPFVCFVPLKRHDYLLVLDLFLMLARLVAICAVLQFASQFVLGQGWMFPFDRLLPAAFFIPDFNLVIEMGGGLTKATGLWLLEPSHLSQLMALAILVELRWFGRPRHLALFGLGLFLAFSGTGLLLLGVFLPVLLARRGHWPWLAAAPVILAALLALFGDVFPFSFFLGRLGEFANAQSSGAMRLFGPWRAMADLYAARPDLVLLGTGPGGMADAVLHFDYAVQDSSWLKLLVEYGLVGAAPFALFYGYCLFAGAADRFLAAALLFQVLFLGGFLLSFYVQFLILALVVWPRPEPQAGPVAGLDAANALQPVERPAS